MGTFCLTDDEIEELTKRRRFRAQARVLARLGIPVQRRPDGCFGPRPRVSSGKNNTRM
ncbi:MAG: DUF4224 domain-containing protein [Gammaproteobacteria bacterium]